MKNLIDYKEGDLVTLIEEGPGFYRAVSANVVSVKEAKNGVRIVLRGRDIPTANWIQVEGNRIKALDSVGSERLVYDKRDEADAIHMKKLRDYVPKGTVLRIKDDEPTDDSTK